VNQQEAKRKRQRAKTNTDQLLDSLSGGAEPDRYGRPLIEGATQLEYELMSFADHLGLQKAGVTKYQNLINIVSILFPDVVISPWTERMLKSLCDYAYVSWCGCAASGKTYTSALYAVVWWLANPLNSCVILCTTTKGMLRRRVWTEIQQLYMAMPGNKIGNMVDSQMTWQSVPGDQRHAIFGIAVADGNTNQAAAMIQGVHAKRVLLIIDEAAGCPQAIFDASANLSVCEDFQMLCIANPVSKSDVHGRFSEPRDGWSSVSIETQEWETVNHQDGKPGICVRFDGERSPNIVANGKVPYPFLVTKQQVDNAHKEHGANSPLLWRYFRGMWAPDGMLKVVFTHNLVSKMKAHQGHLFTGRRKDVIGGCDPAFTEGGDRAVIRFAEIGETQSGIIGIELDTIEYLDIDASSDDPPHYQLASQIIEWCGRKGCRPENFGIDSTGEGGGLLAILHREWSKKVIGVSFNSKASDRPVSGSDKRKCNEVYDRYVTELWFACKTYLESGQLRGIDGDTTEEFSNRTYEEVKAKIKLQTKREMKETFLKSPDIADATAIVVEVARQKGVTPSTASHVEDTNTEWKDWSEQTNAVYEQGSEDEMIDHAYAEMAV